MVLVQNYHAVVWGCAAVTGFFQYGMGLLCGDWFFPNKEEMLICDPHLFPIKNYLLYGTNPVGISARKCSN